MNLLDFAVLLVIIGCCFRGITKGLVFSVFHVISFFAAAFGAAKLYPSLSKIIMQTSIYESVKKGITEILLKNTNPSIYTASTDMAEVGTKMSDVDTGTIHNMLQSISESLLLPESIKTSLIDIKGFDMNQLINIENIVEHLSANVSIFIVNIISIMLIFFALKFLLFIIASVLDGIMKLPLLNELNKVGGAIFGIVNGLLIVYIVFAVITVLSPIEVFIPIVEMINESAVAKTFYNHNILLQYILPLN